MRKDMMSVIIITLAWFCLSKKVQAAELYSGYNIAYIPGFTTVGSNVMYSLGNGTFLKDTWFSQGNYVWHFDSNGFVQTGIVEIEGQLWNLSIDGIATPVPALSETLPDFIAQPAPVTDFSQIVMTALTQCISPDMTPDQKLYASYMYVINKTTYERTYETPAGDWTKPYALDVYVNGKGNCYRYAAAFAYMAKALGYDARVCTGQIQAARGGLTPHGWVEINMEGISYIFDPDMQDAKNRDFYYKTYENYPVKPLIKQTEWSVNF